jgi:hypothetical protein
MSSSSDSVLDDILAAAESLSVSAPTPSLSPGVSFPLIRRLSTRRGGLAVTEGTVPVKLFSVIDIDCLDTLLYCFGVIGTGSAFCVKKNCNVKIHANVKVSFAGLDESFVFIRRNIPGSVFSEPKLASKKVPVDVMAEWESKNFSIIDWATEFQAIDGTNEVPTSAEEIQTESDFLLESSLMRTPGKRKKDSLSGEKFEGPLPGVWKSPRYTRTIPSNPMELEDLIEEGIKRGVLTSAVSRIETYIEGMGMAVDEATAIHHDRLVLLEDNLEVMIGMVQTLKGRIGSTVHIGEQYTAPTLLWGATAFIADDLTRVCEEMSVMKDQFINPMQEMIDSLSSAEAEHSLKNDKVVRAVKLLLSRIQAINELVQDVKTDLVLVRTEQSVRFSSSPPTSDDPADDLMDYILAEGGTSTPARKSVRGGADPSPRIVSPPKGTGKEDVSVDDESVMSILSKLIQDVKTLQSSKQNTTVKFGGLGFSDLADCAAWIEKHFSDHQYGLIMDPLLMLDRIYGEEEVSESGGALLKSMELQYKMKIDSGGEAAALNALRYSRPRVFHKGRPTIVSVQNKSRLNAILTHADWNPGGEGVKDYCVEKMNLLEEVISDEIRNTFEPESTAHWIANKCLTATVSFLNQLFGCIESIYKRLYNFSKFTTEQAWSLTTQVLDRILADLFIPKDNIVQTLKTRNTPATCAQVLYAAFKTHDIMAVYVSHKFENHPSVSTEYVKFLATNSGSEKVVKLMEVVEILKGKLQFAIEDAKVATKKADISASKCSDLSKVVDTLISRVKMLEKK